MSIPEARHCACGCGEIVVPPDAVKVERHGEEFWAVDQKHAQEFVSQGAQAYEKMFGRRPSEPEHLGENVAPGRPEGFDPS